MKETQKLNESATVWGIHCAIDKESIFLDNNVIAIGWREMGDLSRIAPNRDAIPLKKVYIPAPKKDTTQEG